MAEFEWTPEGRQLLSIFEAKIRYYGGPEKLCDIICEEDRVFKKQKDIELKSTPFKAAKRKQMGYILKMWNKYATPVIASKLRISHDTVTLTAKMLKLGRNKANDFFSAGQQNKATNWVLNTETGIYYENLMLAAKAAGITWHLLYFHLNKRKKGNKTVFIKV